MRLRIGAVGLLLLLFNCGKEPEPQPIVQNIELEKIIKTACKLEWRHKVTQRRIGSGSGTCIYKSFNGNDVIAYFITAAHVVNAPIPPYSMYRPDELTLIVCLWEYIDTTGKILTTREYDAEIVWVCTKIDAAIISIAAPEININCAKLADKTTCDALSIGDTVIRSGCPIFLPPLLVHGYIARFDVYIEQFNRTYDLFMLHTYGGDSGSGIFLEETYEIVGITCIGYSSMPYICGATPISLIIEELLETPYKFLVTLEKKAPTSTK